MVSPSRRRAAVAFLVRRHPVSERRVCQLLDQHRSTQRYVPQPPDYELQLAKRMNQLAAKYPRWGYRRIWKLLRQEGFDGVNLKRIYRLWRLEGHQVPRWHGTQGKRAQGDSSNAIWNLMATRPNEVWSYDFLMGRTEDGLPIRVLNIVDEFTRRAVHVRVARSIGTRDVIASLETAFELHGKPAMLRSDNGREFIAATLATWLLEQDVRQVFVEKGSPQQNAFVERFNRTMRDEVLNGESFHSVLEARVVILRWVDEYNTVRPHRGLDMQTPNAYFAGSKVGRQ
jgi:transposase InsO family protein